MQMATQRWMESSNQWKNDSYASGEHALAYRYRVKCDEHYYGDGCAALCRPRDDKFGHYQCDERGNKVCLPGWQGEYCTKGTSLLPLLTFPKFPYVPLRSLTLLIRCLCYLALNVVAHLCSRLLTFPYVSLSCLR